MPWPFLRRRRPCPNPTAALLPSPCPPCRFLLLEDPDTGDVLLPLIYLKPILGANYSRKLAALKHRQVTGEKAAAAPA